MIPIRKDSIMNLKEFPRIETLMKHTLISTKIQNQKQRQVLLIRFENESKIVFNLKF